MPRILVLGTHNRKKGIELVDLLTPHGFELRTLNDFDNPLEVAESGDSFEANAILKARQQALHLGHWVVGEDSGLAVDALGGAPGIFSARFAGDHGDDNQNNRKLLDELDTTPREKRTAHYVCHAALSDPQGNIRAQCEDCCHGRIRTEPQGDSGFGYDPLFEIVEYHRTFGQIGDTTKSVLSHRSRALRRFIPKLLALTAGDRWKD
jgi:XTP/dITP diphosphohydrolase